MSHVIITCHMSRYLVRQIAKVCEGLPEALVVGKGVVVVTIKAIKAQVGPLRITLLSTCDHEILVLYSPP